MTLFWNYPMALSVPKRPLSSDLVLESLANLDADAVVLPPSIIEVMSESPENVRALSRLKLVVYVGGRSRPLDSESTKVHRSGTL